GRLPPEVGGLNFQGLNRNKRGVTIDIGQEAGSALVRRLVAQADVLVENFRPGVMERHGLGYDALREVNPRLVYCSITAFGPRGPLAQKPGMDLILQATGGLMGHTGEPDGPPIKSAPPVADITTGIYAAYGIAAALFERAGSGLGQRVEVAMLDAVVSLFSDVAANVLTDAQRYAKFGSGHPDLAPYQPSPARGAAAWSYPDARTAGQAVGHAERCGAARADARRAHRRGAPGARGERRGARRATRGGSRLSGHGARAPDRRRRRRRDALRAAFVARPGGAAARGGVRGACRRRARGGGSGRAYRPRRGVWGAARAGSRPRHPGPVPRRVLLSQRYGGGGGA